MWIKIKPIDTLFFRTGRPLVIGEDTWAETIFPPLPSTLYGAIRSFLIFQRGSLKDFINGKFKDELGVPCKKEIGTSCKEEKGSLKIKGPLLIREGDILFPSPLDLYKYKDSDEKKLYKFNISDKSKIFISDFNIDNLLINRQKKQIEDPEGWISIFSLKNYLKNDFESISYIENECIYVREYKIGIRRSRKTFSTETGYLYRIPLIRLKNEVFLLSKIEGIKEFSDEGVFQLGGESKGVSFKKLEDKLVKYLDEILNLNFEFKNKIFKLIFITPPKFKKGWMPEWINEKNSMQGSHKGIELKLLTCAIGKPIYIGGWDLRRRRPKKMVKTVPPGSVYYFKILNNASPEKIKEVFHFKNISDMDTEEGFGLAVVGKV